MAIIISRIYFKGTVNIKRSKATIGWKKQAILSELEKLQKAQDRGEHEDRVTDGHPHRGGYGAGEELAGGALA